jgi:hypothetical protein
MLLTGLTSVRNDENTPDRMTSYPALASARSAKGTLRHLHWKVSRIMSRAPVADPWLDPDDQPAVPKRGHHTGILNVPRWPFSGMGKL